MNDGIRLDRLAVGYGNKILIRDISLQVTPGQILTLIGPNGSGKSTILKSITRQLQGMGGVVYLNGKDMASMTASEIATSLSMVMTERPDPELMTCRDVVATGRYPYTGRMGILRRVDWKKVDEALQLLQVDEIADSSFQQISDGQRQRVMLARAMCQDTDILILDEPTSFLDIRYKVDILSYIRTIVQTKQVAVIMSLHELDLAMKISDQIACVDGEKIAKIGTPDEIMAGDFIHSLYQLEANAFDPMTGILQMPTVTGNPQVFVIGGGGSGIPTYYRLQRERVPFAAGILAENDIEYPIAKALATKVYGSQAFEAATIETLEAAKEAIDACEKVICTVEHFGTYNQYNRELAEYAKVHK